MAQIVYTITENTTTYGATSTENDEMIGGQGDDQFFGGYDTMWGDDGNDTFTIKNQGTVYGGTGGDTITVTNTNAALASWLEGNSGSDSITAGAGNDTLFSVYGQNTLKGGNGNDNYVITFDDFFNDDGTVGAGADTITETSTGGVDTVYFIRDFAADGRDDDIGSDGKELTDPTLKGNDFYVTLANNVENGVLDDQTYIFTPDTVTYFVAQMVGNSLNNNLKGSGLNDILDGAGGNDVISAGDGNDVVFVGNGVDTIDGGAGTDFVASSVDFNVGASSVNIENIDLLDFAAAITATGTSGNNTIIGNLYNNTLNGEAGNDTLDGWWYSPIYAPVVDTLKTTGIDTLVGGAGNDLYRIDSVDDAVVESATGQGTDTVEFKGAVSTDTYTLTSGVENLKMLGNLKNAVGNALSNKIYGDSGINNIKGDFGDDYLDGGTGLDSFEGGYGNDTYVVDSLSEIIKEFAGQGSDWVQSGSISLDLNNVNWGGSIESARLTGTTVNLNVTGNDINNVLIGNDAGNVLDGRGGVDALQGGKGDDTYYVDTTTDVLIENVSEGADTVQSSVNFSIENLLNFENISLSPVSGATTATGNSNNNTVKGNELVNTLFGLAGNDIFDGGAGADNLIGGIGDDTYILSNDGDIITELANEGSDTVEIGVTYTLSDPLLNGNVENLKLTGTDAVNGTGSNGANTITGNSKANTLTGLEGADRLVGGDGTDTLIGGLGADVIDLTESLAVNDIVKVNIGDSNLNAAEADRIIKFAFASDTLDLATTGVAASVAAKDGIDASGFKSHSITNGFIKFDDADTFSSALSITSSNISGALDYLKTNITDGSTVAFLGTAVDPNSTTSASVSSTWVFQDNGATDTLIALVGVTSATSVSDGAFSATAIHLA